MADSKIVLASASQRRQQLLREVFGDIEIRLKDVDESFPSTLQGAEIAEYLANKKAKEFDSGDDILITADTIVCLDEHILNKPADAADAFRMLQQLNGRTHQVYTGVCISHHNRQLVFSERSDVTFNQLSDEQIRNYVEHYKPFDKAGAYGAQESLPVGMNPLSQAEKDFLKLINSPDLFEKSLAVKEHAPSPLIAKIEGSYFNVMGLPLVRVVQEINKRKSYTSSEA